MEGMKLCSFELSKTLKKKGYFKDTDLCFITEDNATYYNGNLRDLPIEVIKEMYLSGEIKGFDDDPVFIQPYIYEAVDYLREKKIHVTIIYTANTDGFYNTKEPDGYFYIIKTFEEGIIIDSAAPEGNLFSDFYEALSEGVTKALELLP